MRKLVYYIDKQHKLFIAYQQYIRSKNERHAEGNQNYIAAITLSSNDLGFALIDAVNIIG